MFKEMVEIFKDMIKSLIGHHLDLWYGEEYSDLPKALKVVVSTLGVFLDITGIALFIAFLPVVILVGLFIRFFYKGSFNEQDDLS